MKDLKLNHKISDTDKKTLDNYDKQDHNLNELKLCKKKKI
jgi:hypothetical protein